MSLKEPLFFALFACLACLGRAEAVTLAEEKGGERSLYRIEGVFEVEAPREQVWGVLTDYGALKGVVSSMLESQVIWREGSKVLVQQVAQGSFFFFRKKIRLLLNIDEDPQSSLHFTETSGKSFSHYHGSWTLEDNNEGLVKVTYLLSVSSSQMAPAFIERGLFKDNALSLLRELKAEIVRRSALQAAAQKKIPS